MATSNLSSKFFKNVNFPTSGKNTLNKVFNNIPDVYKATPLLHLGLSDQLSLSSVPPYTVWTAQVWTQDYNIGLFLCYRLECIYCGQRSGVTHSSCPLLHKLLYWECVCVQDKVFQNQNVCAGCINTNIIIIIFFQQDKEWDGFSGILRLKHFAVNSIYIF